MYKVGDKVVIKSTRELMKVSTFNFDRKDCTLLPVPKEVLDMEEEQLRMILKISGKIAEIDSFDGCLYLIRINDVPGYVFSVDDESIEGHVK